MRYGDSLSLLSLASTHSGGGGGGGGGGDFPIQSSTCTWQVEVTSGSTGSSRAPQYCTRIRSMHSLSVCPSSNFGGVFVRDSGRSFSLCPESQLEKKNSALAMMK